MIVSIYEMHSKELHWYTNPTLYNESGFNRLLARMITLYSYPRPHEDEKRRPFNSDCVTSALQSDRKGLINSNKIALITPIWGYETALLVNLSPLFAPHVSGVTDLAKLLFKRGWNTTKPDMWRFASKELRMGHKHLQTAWILIVRSLTSIEKLNTSLCYYGAENKIRRWIGAKAWNIISR
jgi:hypothetical protein